MNSTRRAESAFWPIFLTLMYVSLMCDCLNTIKHALTNTAIAYAPFPFSLSCRAMRSPRFNRYFRAMRSCGETGDLVRQRRSSVLGLANAKKHVTAERARMLEEAAMLKRRSDAMDDAQSRGAQAWRASNARRGRADAVAQAVGGDAPGEARGAGRGAAAEALRGRIGRKIAAKWKLRRAEIDAMRALHLAAGITISVCTAVALEDDRRERRIDCGYRVIRAERRRRRRSSTGKPTLLHGLRAMCGSLWTKFGTAATARNLGSTRSSDYKTVSFAIQNSVICMIFQL